MRRWQVLQDLFDETVDLAPDERARVLRERTGGDGDLAREVEELVAADRAPFDEIERTSAEMFSAVLSPDPPAHDLCGLEFGAYRIDEHVSSGGMGHVYRATRTAAGTERRCALKVLRPGLDPVAFLARFRREREVLARLEHEHIVAFLDAGTLPDGRPFLVMEYVEGTPITAWAQSARAGMRRRIELFRQVCAAVQYAHRMLVVHRDLKPWNVLVTEKGVPKLLDFGVASVLADGADTLRGPLTPAYAAPESVAHERPTPANDVYSLGVMLHELLCGELPGGGGPRALGGARSRALGRDLDAVVAKAMHADPLRRYESAEHLAEDLRRHLANEPVEARAGSFGYRAACFVRRRRWSILTAAAIVAALVVGWITSELGRRSAERESTRGWHAHAEAKAVGRVLEGWILATASVDEELAGRAAAHLETALAEDLAELPEAETLVRLTLARLYLDRGDRERARVHAERAWELSQSTSGVGPAERKRAAELRDLARGVSR